MILGVTDGFTKSLELVELVIESNQGQKIRFSSWFFSQYCFKVALK
jgi:hypothetical protein